MIKKLTLLSLFLTIGFTSHSSSNQQNNPDSTKINKLLVIVLVRNPDNRKTLEDELAYSFSDYGIRTVPSHTTRLSGAEHVTKSEVKKASRKVGADGVLIVKLVDIKQENSYSYNQRAQYMGAGAPTSATSSGVVFTTEGTYSWGTYAYGNYFDAVSSSKVMVLSDLIDIQNEKLLLTKDKSMRVGDIEQAIGKFSKKLTKQMVKSKHFVSEKE